VTCHKHPSPDDDSHVQLPDTDAEFFSSFPRRQRFKSSSNDRTLILFSMHNIATLDNLCCVIVEERQLFTRLRLTTYLSATQFETAADRNILRPISLFRYTV
jgi:hypothetical protein